MAVDFLFGSVADCSVRDFTVFVAAALQHRKPLTLQARANHTRSSITNVSGDRHVPSKSRHGPDDEPAPADFQHPRIRCAPLRRQRNRLAPGGGRYAPLHLPRLPPARQRLANALQALGVRMGERVGTLAWNGYRHLEAYYAVSGSGAVLHTINPRLHPEQLAYICNHAEDQYLLFDFCFLPLVEALRPTAARSRAIS
jgi:non-ribosomal peptide synthetase component F